MKDRERCEVWEHNGSRRGAMVRCRNAVERHALIDGRWTRVCDEHSFGHLSKPVTR